MADSHRTQAALLRLREIYARAEREIAANPRLFCLRSGRCCRFREAGHELFLTALEYAGMVGCGGAGGEGEGEAGEICPYLEKGLCANREGRALACRTYFCSDEGLAAEVTERFHREIRALHDEFGLPYVYRSLTWHGNCPPADSVY